MKNTSKSGSILYIMIHCPRFWMVKIGITGKTVTGRAAQVDKAVWGFPIPIGVAIVPGAYFVEQFLHRKLRGINRRFYVGDGSTEWFLLPAAVSAYVVIVVSWGVWAWLISLCVKWDALEWYVCFLRVLWGWAGLALEQIVLILEKMF